MPYLFSASLDWCEILLGEIMSRWWFGRNPNCSKLTASCLPLIIPTQPEEDKKTKTHQKDNNTKGEHDKRQTRQQDNQTTAEQDKRTIRQKNNKTTGQQDNETTILQENSTTGQSDNRAQMCVKNQWALSGGDLPRKGNQSPGSCYTLSGWIFIFFCLCLCIFCFDVLI